MSPCRQLVLGIAPPELLRLLRRVLRLTIDEKEAEALLAVLSPAADFCEQHGADRDLVKRLKAAIDKLTANRDTAVGRAASLRNHLTHFGKGAPAGYPSRIK